MSTAHLAQAQQLSTAALIELFTLDASAISDAAGNYGSVYTWTPGTAPAPRTLGTVLIAGAPNLLVLDRVVTLSGGGYTVQCVGANSVTVQNLPVLASGIASFAPFPTYLVVPSFPSGLPPPNSSYTLVGPGTVAFGGVAYDPYPVISSGWEWKGRGTLPRPTLRLDNTLLLPGSPVPLAAALVITYGDLVGATVTRLRTFANFLDGAANADPSACFEPDVYRVDRKSAHNKAFIEWELAASIDQLGLKLPARTVHRDICDFKYRSWNPYTSSFVLGTCPYNGGSYFDAKGDGQSDPSKDVCSKQIPTGCLKRFPQPTPLPYSGFPGVNLVAS